MVQVTHCEHASAGYYEAKRLTARTETHSPSRLGPHSTRQLAVPFVKPISSISHLRTLDRRHPLTDIARFSLDEGMRGSVVAQRKND